MRAISRVSTPVHRPCASTRACAAITISSSDALPARSPMPLIAHSTWRQPAGHAGERVGHRQPRSSWQWSRSPRCAGPGRAGRAPLDHRAYSSGHRVADGVGHVDRRGALVDRDLETSAVNSRSARVASIGENSTSSVYCVACATAARAWPLTSSRVVWSWCSMWMSQVEMNVWMRGRSESLTAFQAASMSWALARARPQMTGPCDLPRDRLHRLEVAGRADREAGLDDVDAEARELLRDLHLLLRVERDPGGLLAVAHPPPQRRWILYSPLLLPPLFFSLSFSSFVLLWVWLVGPPPPLPPGGGGRERGRGGGNVTFFFFFLQEAVRLGAALDRERLGDDGPDLPLSIHSRSGSRNSSAVPLSSHSVSMFSPMTAFDAGIICIGWKTGVGRPSSPPPSGRASRPG